MTHESGGSKRFQIFLVVLGTVILGIPAGIIINAFSSDGQSAPGTPPSSLATSVAHGASVPPPTSKTPGTPIQTYSDSSPTPGGQPAYRLQWRGKQKIGVAGINVTEAAIDQSDGGDYDVQYQTDGWQTNGSAEVSFFYWLPRGTPDPSSCVGRTTDANKGLPEPTGHRAHVGDRYCYVDFGEDTTVVAFMSVTRVDSNGVTVDARLWDHA